MEKRVIFLCLFAPFLVESSVIPIEAITNDLQKFALQKLEAMTNNFYARKITEVGFKGGLMREFGAN